MPHPTYTINRSIISSHCRFQRASIDSFWLFHTLLSQITPSESLASENRQISILITFWSPCRYVYVNILFNVGVLEGYSSPHRLRPAHYINYQVYPHSTNIFRSLLRDRLAKRILLPFVSALQPRLLDSLADPKCRDQSLSNSFTAYQPPFCPAKFYFVFQIFRIGHTSFSRCISNEASSLGQWIQVFSTSNF